jgi:hypothetical protein
LIDILKRFSPAIAVVPDDVSTSVFDAAVTAQPVTAVEEPVTSPNLPVAAKVVQVDGAAITSALSLGEVVSASEYVIVSPLAAPVVVTGTATETAVPGIVVAAAVVPIVMALTAAALAGTTEIRPKPNDTVATSAMRFLNVLIDIYFPFM